MVVRLPNLDRPALTLEKEIHWLPVLAPQLPLAVPEVVARGEPAEDFPFAWAVYSWLDGHPATDGPPADLGQAADDLASFVAALQRLDPNGGPGPGDHNVWRGEPLRRRDESVRSAILELGDAIDGEHVTAAWERALEAPDWDGAPVWIHGDLDARNVLVRDGRLSAAIDWGCLGVGDPACDVMVAWKLLDAETRPGFREALPIDDATWMRACGWALMQGLVAVSYWTLETNAALLREAESWLAEVLADGTLGP
jgi:aminoglycoside phosphotransferase (APT) family kinase protein